MIPFWYFIPTVVCILSGGFVFLFCKQIKGFQKFMGFTLVFEGLFIMLGGILRTKLTTFQTPVYLLYICMMLLSPFLYWFATKYLTSKEGIRKRDFWMLEVVAVLFFVLISVISNVPLAQRDMFLSIMNGTCAISNTIPAGTAVLLGLDDLTFLIYLLEQLFVVIFCFINLSRYRETLAQYYSSTEGKSLGAIYLLFTAVALRYFFLIGMNFFPALSSGLGYRIAQTAVFCLFYGVTAFFTCRIRCTAEELRSMIAAQTALPAAAPSTPAASELIKSRVDSLIGEKFFLDPDIDIMTVAARVQVNYKYLSDYLRQAYNETFMVFVNRLRIENAIALLKDNSLSTLDIAEQSGFVSESTFYRNFIKVTGVTPAKYRKNA